MEPAEEAGHEVFTTGKEERIPDAAACSREEGKEEEVEEMEVSFDELGLHEQLKRALRKKGIAKATPIQWEVIPLILEGKDVVAKAKTGSGKTFAYLLPLLHELLKLSSEGPIRKPAPNAFIMVPTRELYQLHDKLLSNKEIPAHLRDVPDYLIDPKTKEESNVVKFSRAAMGTDKPQKRKRHGFKGGSGKSRDPLKTFSAEGKRRRKAES